MGADVWRKTRRKLAKSAATDIRYKVPQRASCRGGSTAGSAIVGGVSESSEFRGCGPPSTSSGLVSCGKKGDVRFILPFGGLRNCCIEGGSSSGGISMARSSGGSSLSIALCVLLSSSTSSILPLLLLLPPLSALAYGETRSWVLASRALLPRSFGLLPSHELFIPPLRPRPRSSRSLPSAPSSRPEPRLRSSSASLDSPNRLPPNCRLDRCKA